MFLRLACLHLRNHLLLRLQAEQRVHSVLKNLFEITLLILVEFVTTHLDDSLDLFDALHEHVTFVGEPLGQKVRRVTRESGFFCLCDIVLGRVLWIGELANKLADTLSNELHSESELLGLLNALNHPETQQNLLSVA